MKRQFEGRYFDGESAVAGAARATFEKGALFTELQNRSFAWTYRDIVELDSGPGECRLSARSAEDAVLVLPEEARTALLEMAPDHHGDHIARRRFAAAVAIMVGAAAFVGGVLFIGVPAASGSLARATPQSFETRIGANMAAQIRTVYRPCGNDEALTLLRPVIDDMAESGGVGFDITFHFARTSAPNAFALPGGQIMATSGLLDAVGNDQEAFLAVISHELGHVRGRDGMRAFYRNAGLGLFLEIVTGGSGVAQQAVLLTGQLTQLRHTRAQEAAADETAYEIMNAYGLDPAALARAFEAISAHASMASTLDDADRETSRRRKLPNWLKTHPETAGRIEAARNQPGSTKSLPLSEDEWTIARKACQKIKD